MSEGQRVGASALLLLSADDREAVRTYWKIKQQARRDEKTLARKVAETREVISELERGGAIKAVARKQKP